MKLISTKIKDLFIIEPTVFGDDRGYFYESFNHHLFSKLIGKEVNFVQDNQSMSGKNIVRGLHFQNPPFAQGKLVISSLKDGTIFSYKCTNYYNKESEGSIAWDDKTLNLNWEVENPIISEKDQNSPSLKELKSKF